MININQTTLLFVIFLMSFFILKSCKPPYYGAGYISSNMMLMQKPFYDSAKVSENYCSVRIGKGTEYMKDDTNRFSDISLYRSSIFKNNYISYGIFGYRGHYQINHVEYWYGRGNYVGNIYEYKGLGVRIAYGKIFKLSENNNVEIGILGTYSYENGSYQDFLKKAKKEGDIDTSSSPDNFLTGGGVIGYTRKLGKDSYFNFQFLSYLGEHERLFLIFPPFGIGTSIQYKNLQAVAQMNNFVQEDYSYKILHSPMKFSYQLGVTLSFLKSKKR
jgi:hypothetical protein